MESYTEWGPMRWGSLVVFNTRGAILLAQWSYMIQRGLKQHGVLYRMESYALGSNSGMRFYWVLYNMDSYTLGSNCCI